MSDPLVAILSPDRLTVETPKDSHAGSFYYSQVGTSAMTRLAHCSRWPFYDLDKGVARETWTIMLSREMGTYQSIFIAHAGHVIASLIVHQAPDEFRVIFARGIEVKIATLVEEIGTERERESEWTRRG